MVGVEFGLLVTTAPAYLPARVFVISTAERTSGRGEKGIFWRSHVDAGASRLLGRGCRAQLAQLLVQPDGTQNVGDGRGVPLGARPGGRYSVGVQPRGYCTQRVSFGPFNGDPTTNLDGQHRSLPGALVLGASSSVNLPYPLSDSLALELRRGRDHVDDQPASALVVSTSTSSTTTDQPLRSARLSNLAKSSVERHTRSIFDATSTSASPRSRRSSALRSPRRFAKRFPLTPGSATWSTWRQPRWGDDGRQCLAPRDPHLSVVRVKGQGIGL